MHKKPDTRILVWGLAALVVLAGCRPADYSYSRYEPETRNKLEEADELFFDKDFAAAQKAYQDILTDDPECVDAAIGEGRCMRYQGNLDQAAGKFADAYGMEKSNPRANLYYGKSLMPFYGMAPEDKSAHELASQSVKHLETALKGDPGLIDAHLTLWPAYIMAGKYEKADAQVKALIDKDYFPQPVLDWGYNLLVGAGENAILFTNGDLDTYPLLALQQAEGLRTDVKVVNVALLNTPWYASYVRDRAGVPISLSDEELAALVPETKDGEVKLPADVLMDDIISNAGNTPVYFAMLPSDRIEAHCTYPSREGLLARAGQESDPPFNLDKALANAEKMRGVDMPDKLEEWSLNTSPLTRDYSPLYTNYAAVYAKIADALRTQGKDEKALEFLGKAVDMVARFGNTQHDDYLKMTIDAWLADDPDNPQLKGLKKKLGI